MLFNSLEFLAFLTIVYALYRLLPFRAQNWFLLAASYLFYGWWDTRFLFLLILSTTVDYAVGLLMGVGKMTPAQRIRAAAFLLTSAIAFLLVNWPALAHAQWPDVLVRQNWPWLTFGTTILLIVIANALHTFIASMPESQRKRLMLWITILVNLGILGFFKYFNFFSDNLQSALAAAGLHVSPVELRVILPVGVSFYTFQALSYTIDIYRGRMQPTPRLLDYALFVAFFPQLVAGPIERACDLLPRLSRPRTITYDQSSDGLFLILFGLFKKIAIADGVAGPVAAVYATQNASPADILAATLLFALQIYCDFSAYSDIARGCAQLLGTSLMVNFNQPFFARNPADFWRRWHISLSSWLRDYLYIPLGGNRQSPRKTYRNLMLTMSIGGLWHGAAWNYVLWGLYQGGLLCGHRALTGTREKTAQPRWTPLAIAACLAFVLYGWLLFRANSAAQIYAYTHTLFSAAIHAHLGPLTMPLPTFSALLGVLLLAAYELYCYTAHARPFAPIPTNHVAPAHTAIARLPTPARGLFYASLILLCLMGTSNAPAQFIYFQF